MMAIPSDMGGAAAKAIPTSFTSISRAEMREFPNGEIGRWLPWQGEICQRAAAR